MAVLHIVFLVKLEKPEETLALTNSVSAIKHLPCPKSKAACKNKKRLWQNLLMGLTSGHGMHHPHKSGANYFPNKPSKHYHHHTTHQHRERPRTLNTHFNPFKIFG